MQDLVDLLLHPGDWSAVDELSGRKRLLLAVVVAGITIVLAVIGGSLSARWARRRAAVTDAADAERERRVRKLRSGFVLLVAGLGASVVVGVAPLAQRTADVLSGALYVLVAIVVARLVVHAAALTTTAWIRRMPDSERRHAERDFLPLVQKVLGAFVFVVLLVAVAKRFGRDLSSLLAALGVGSLAIGLAAQQTLGNMIAGFVLLVDRPFRPGDRIKLATNEIGDVLEVGVRSTRIQLLDRNLLIVPNTELVNSRVVNMQAPTVHADIKFVLAHGADVERASAALLGVALADAHVVQEPAPSVRLAAVTDVGYELVLGIDAATAGGAFAAEERLRRAALARLGAEGVALARRPSLPA